jgi:hypothetical protein
VLVIREVAAAYLIYTLAVTALSKARLWRITSASIRVDGAVPRKFAVAVTLGLIGLELGLAALIATHLLPRVIGLATAALFTTFAAYKIAVFLRLGTVGCSCAGKADIHEGRNAALAASVLATIVQAGFACLYGFTPPADRGAWIPVLFGAAVLAVPLLFFARSISASRPGDIGDQVSIARVGT